MYLSAFSFVSFPAFFRLGHQEKLLTHCQKSLEPTVGNCSLSGIFLFVIVALPRGHCFTLSHVPRETVHCRGPKSLPRQCSLVAREVRPSISWVLLVNLYKYIIARLRFLGFMLLYYLHVQSLWEYTSKKLYTPQNESCLLVIFVSRPFQTPLLYYQ